MSQRIQPKCPICSRQHDITGYAVMMDTNKILISWWCPTTDKRFRQVLDTVNMMSVTGKGIQEPKFQPRTI